MEVMAGSLQLGGNGYGSRLVVALLADSRGYGGSGLLRALLEAVVAYLGASKVVEEVDWSWFSGGSDELMRVQELELVGFTWGFVEVVSFSSI